MILKKGHSRQYLKDYKDGKISKGLDTGCELDTYLRFKRRQFNCVMGGDNVGKTFFIEWYFLVLSLRHGLRWCLWTDENSSGQVMRDLIQMASGKPFKSLSIDEIYYFEEVIEKHFYFIDNKQPYTPDSLLQLFDSIDCDGYLIDPFNQLEHDMTYKSNIELIRKLKRWCKKGNKTIYLTMHPITSTGRQSSLYHDRHEWAGHPKIPGKADAEGGKIFANMCDDFIIVHRLTKHNELNTFTMVDIDKIKDKDTGGQPTNLNEQVMLEYNNGLGFKCFGVDPINRKHLKVKKPYHVAKTFYQI